LDVNVELVFRGRLDVNVELVFRGRLDVNVELVFRGRLDVNVELVFRGRLDVNVELVFLCLPIISRNDSHFFRYMYLYMKYVYVCIFKYINACIYT